MKTTNHPGKMAITGTAGKNNMAEAFGISETRQKEIQEGVQAIFDEELNTPSATINACLILEKVSALCDTPQELAVTSWSVSDYISEHNVAGNSIEHLLQSLAN